MRFNLFIMNKNPSPLSVCMITCWYHNISMANYSENLVNALMRKDVSVRIVTSHCMCKYKYRDSSTLFDGQYCLVTTPLDHYGDEPHRSRIQIPRLSCKPDSSGTALRKAVFRRRYSPLSTKPHFILSGSCPYSLFSHTRKYCIR